MFFFSAALSTAINITEGNRWIMLDPGCVCVHVCFAYISSEWLRTCERYPGVAKSYLIMRRTPLDKSQLIRCPMRLETMFDFF
jgi:hypothetical protein